jgi:hypothetical protein
MLTGKQHFSLLTLLDRSSIMEAEEIAYDHPQAANVEVTNGSKATARSGDCSDGEADP